MTVDAKPISYQARWLKTPAGQAWLARPETQQRRRDALKRYKESAKGRASSAQYVRSEAHLRSRLKRDFGLALEVYVQMEREQGGVCAICKRSQRLRGGRLFVDHCHATGKVRGLLCGHCNSGIGYFYDNPELLVSASEYLVERGQ